MAKTTRQQTKDKLDTIVRQLEAIEQTAIEIGLLYQDSDSDVSGAMYLLSTMIETSLPIIRDTNKKL